MGSYKGFWIPYHEEPKCRNPMAWDYCKKSYCNGLTFTMCENCLFDFRSGNGRPEFKEWLKEKEAR
jgi:hypothetical protein